MELNAQSPVYYTEINKTTVPRRNTLLFAAHKTDSIQVNLKTL